MQKEGSWETELSKKVEAENWWNPKLMNTPVYFSHSICTQKGGNSLSIPRWQRREFGSTPTILKHDERRPVLEAGLRVELQEKSKWCCYLVCRVLTLRSLDVKPLPDIWVLSHFPSTENAGIYISVSGRKCKSAPAPCQPALRTESAACVKEAKHDRWDWRMDTCQ